MKTKKPKKLSKFYHHEMIDRIDVTLKFIEDNLISHPVCMRSKKLNKKIMKVQNILGNAYRLASNIADGKKLKKEVGKKAEVKPVSL